MTETPRVLAAGGVVLRRAEDGLRTLVIHRPRYDDWSFPKGKLDPGETFEEAAVREVHEETGLRCTLLDPMPPITYPQADGTVKLTRYWVMTVERDEGFTPSDEVDALRWLTLDEASAAVTHPLDRELARRVAQDERVTVSLVTAPGARTSRSDR